MNYTYRCIEAAAKAEFRDRGSRFIASAYPVETVQSFKEILAAVKKEHPKAVHHCFAYRIGQQGELYRSSDDGEPSGTAGKPILGQIDSKQLSNTLVIVVRYFGGTLLGVPGLIHAYKTSAAMALELCVIKEKPILKKYRLEFDYTRMNDAMRLIRQSQADILSQDLQLFCEMEIGVPVKTEELFLKAVADNPSIGWKLIEL